jgi:hypothetical protein
MKITGHAIWFACKWACNAKPDMPGIRTSKMSRRGMAGSGAFKNASALSWTRTWKPWLCKTKLNILRMSGLSSTTSMRAGWVKIKIYKNNKTILNRFFRKQ